MIANVKYISYINIYQEYMLHTLSFIKDIFPNLLLNSKIINIIYL